MNKIEIKKPYTCLINGEFLGLYDKDNIFKMSNTEVSVVNDNIIIKEGNVEATLTNLLPEILNKIKLQGIFFIQGDNKVSEPLTVNYM